ncbi:MAG TPA: hypothetical protein PLZ78_02835 [Spirochaetota bacterium]|nr:hypothetical protein [Spirochaetota bacterium]
MKRRDESSVCPTCGRKIAKYTHSLNVGLVRALAVLDRHGSANIARIGLSHSQIANFNKLRYWGLVEPAAKRGEWRVTAHGKDFLSGRAQVYSQVVTFHNERDRWEGRVITIRDVLPREFAQRSDYAVNREDAAPPPPVFREGRLF